MLVVAAHCSGLLTVMPSWTAPLALLALWTAGCTEPFMRGQQLWRNADDPSITPVHRLRKNGHVLEQIGAVDWVMGICRNAANLQCLCGMRCGLMQCRYVQPERAAEKTRQSSVQQEESL